MDNLSLFTLLLASATFLLALAAFWTIWQNYKFREKDRKERLLNEIIDWAEGVIKSGFSNELDQTKLGEIDNQQKEFAYINNVLSRISNNYEIMKIKSIYINNIASFFDNELLEDIKILTKYLGDYSDEMDYILGTSDKEKDSRGKLKYNSPEASEEIKRRMSSSREILLDQPKKMDIIAEQIIKSATNIKINNIS